MRSKVGRVGSYWDPKPGEGIIRHPQDPKTEPIRFVVTPRAAESRGPSPLILLTLVFTGLISLGFLLLLLPFSHYGTGLTPLLDAIFTATSAVTLTGLATQNTASYWTPFGQVVLLGLIFVSGITFMAIATFLLLLIDQRVSFAQKSLVNKKLDPTQLGELWRLAVRVFMASTIIQFSGFVILLYRLLKEPEHSVGTALWQAAFHSVSSFNNAGFVTFKNSESLSAFQGDGILLGTIATLAILGSASYSVTLDLVKNKRFVLLTINTKLVLVMTSILILTGAFVFLFSEYSNEKTLDGLPILNKVWVSIFESISGRTAGFSTISFADTKQHTNFFFTGLMFVGGAAGSVSGGIKVNALAVALVALLSTMRRNSQTSVFGRELSEVQIQHAMTIGAIATAFVFFISLLLIFSESSKNIPFLNLLFESVSAFGTSGLTTALTPTLSPWGHIILMVTMFSGRIGTLLLVLTMPNRASNNTFQFARERVTIG